MPTYNSGQHLKASIDSILNQTYRNIELLITDDHSDDDNTLQILHSYEQKDQRVKVLFLDSNHGPGYDRWMAEKLEQQIAFMQKEQLALSYTSFVTCDDNNCERGVVIAPRELTFGQLKRDNKIGCLTAVYDVEMLGKKYYMPAIRKRQDWGLFLTIIRDCKRAAGIQAPLAYYRMRKGSVSRNKLGLIKYNILIYQKVLGFSKWKSVVYFYLLFMPTHVAKVLKSKIDSLRYLRKKDVISAGNI